MKNDNEPRSPIFSVKQARQRHENNAMCLKNAFEHAAIRVTQVTKVFPKVTLKGRVFHPDSNDVHISSLI